MIRIVLADDHEIVRTGIRMMLESDPDVQVVGEAADGSQAYSLVAREKPDVLLLDISMPPGRNGLVTCEKVTEGFPATKVIVLTMFAEPDYLLFTLRGGASGYVLKNSSPTQLRSAVHAVAEGDTFIDEKMSELLSRQLAETGHGQSIQKLTGREIEVLQLLARGFTNKEISEKLFLSVKTIEAHRSKIYQKLNIKTRAELVDYAIRHKLMEL